jgi:ElaB/YqjD/DUF883 family membrane-anchored ribosome-binding protein
MRNNNATYNPEDTTVLNKTERAFENTKDNVENKKDLSQTVKDYEKKVVDTIEPIKDRAVTMGRSASAWAKEHPLAASGIALGSGLLLSRLFSGRPSNNSGRSHQISNPK